MDCYFRKGLNKNKSKGLLELTKKLGVASSEKCSLSELRTLLSQHSAFSIPACKELFCPVKIIFFA